MPSNAKFIALKMQIIKVKNNEKVNLFFIRYPKLIITPKGASPYFLGAEAANRPVF